MPQKNALQVFLETQIPLNKIFIALEPNENPTFRFCIINYDNSKVRFLHNMKIYDKNKVFCPENLIYCTNWGTLNCQQKNEQQEAITKQSNCLPDVLNASFCTQVPHSAINAISTLKNRSSASMREILLHEHLFVCRQTKSNFMPSNTKNDYTNEK